MTDPINLQIKRADNTWDIIEAAPLLTEEGHELKPSGTYHLYRGYPEFDSNLFDADAMRERYVESLELTGEDNPGFLGELHFTGIGYFEWRYEGRHYRKARSGRSLIACRTMPPQKRSPWLTVLFYLSLKHL